MLIKALMSAHDLLLEDLRRISKGINQDIDFTGMTSKVDNTKLFNSASPVHLDCTDGGLSPQLSPCPQGSGEVVYFPVWMLYCSFFRIYLLDYLLI